MSGIWLEREVTVLAPAGLHARPAIRLSRLAKGFSARVQLRVGGQDQWIDGKSVAKVMGLRAEMGRTIGLRASGGDAEAALAGLEQFFAGDFDSEAETPA